MLYMLICVYAIYALYALYLPATIALSECAVVNSGNDASLLTALQHLLNFANAANGNDFVKDVSC